MLHKRPYNRGAFCCLAFACLWWLCVGHLRVCRVHLSGRL